MDVKSANDLASMYGQPIDKDPPHTDRMLRFETKSGRQYALQINRQSFLGLWLEPTALASVSGDFEIVKYPVVRGRSSHLSVMKRLWTSKEVIFVKCKDLTSLKGSLDEYTL